MLSEKPRVLVVATGGTIASQYDAAGAYAPCLSGEKLLSVFPGTRQLASFTIRQPCNVLSFALNPATVAQLTAELQETLNAEDYAGALWIQGTATIEETAFLADLLWDCDKPLVFTGSMFNSSEPDWDGPRNIHQAALTAVAAESRGKGVLVCLAGEIHAARDVVKAHKTSLTTFVSPNGGALGLIAGNERVCFTRTPARRRCYAPGGLDSRIDIIKASLGGDGRLIAASAASGARGIVLECMPGGGGIPPAMMEQVRLLRQQGFTFVMAPRSLLGLSTLRTGSGSGPFDLLLCGVISAGDLGSPKARILLMVLQASGLTEDAIRQEFACLASYC